MMESLQIFGQNKQFMMDAYNINAFMSIFFVLALIDVILKGWAMWRAARMKKTAWFIILLIANSFGLLPLIFLLMTNRQYQKSLSQ